MLPWWIRHGSKELPAIAAIAALVGAILVGLYALHAPGRSEGERVDGEIVGFQSFYSKGELRPTQLARVRLQNGLIQNVRLHGPAAVRCRRGDRIVLLRQGAGLVSHPRACADR